MTAVNQARVIAQIGAEVSAEGLASELWKMARDRMKGQIPDNALYGSIAQVLADATAKAAVIAIAGLPEAKAKEALDHLKAGSAEYFDLVFEMAKKDGAFK